MLLARYANDRNPNVGIFALSLLDTIVKTCGYPFHLQISTKEFLNELVRRFPERPPPFPGPVMSRILDLIHTWREGICVHSRWKDDLANIRDMHRLLTFKGYRFRSAPSTDVTLEEAANLKSADELESEDRDAQSAKLQELIRRGTPRDLAAAQELMKSLAGANPEAKPDYRSQALTDLNKLEQKVILLNEMLDNADTERGERFTTGDAYDVRIKLFDQSIRYSRCNTTSNYLLSFETLDRRSRSGYQMLRVMIQNHSVGHCLPHPFERDTHHAQTHSCK